MSLRIRQLDIRASSAKGLYGTAIAFPDGLVILRAENTSGKSLCLQAIMYALGLEGMLGPSREVPLQHAVTDYLELNNERIPILESEVLLEIQNASGKTLTVRRSIKGERARELVTVWQGAVLSDPEAKASPEDFYVRVSGGATAPSGFHRLLTTFLGWSLPQVPTYSGTETLLYLEIIFPLLYVEQKNGWGSIEGRFPTHLRIREPGVRAVEFLLALDSRAMAERRANLKMAQDAIRQRWSAAATEADAAAKEVGAIVQGIPKQPVVEWPPAVAPTLSVPLRDEWIPLDTAVSTMRARVRELESVAGATIESDLPDLREELRAAENAVQVHERRISALLDALNAERSEVERLHECLNGIDEDLLRNKDARKLQSLGATAVLQVAVGLCPTCHQTISDALLPDVTAQEANPMNVDQNIAYLEEQRKLFAFMLSQAASSSDAQERQLANERAQVEENRASIRALRRALVADSRLPSSAALEEKIRLGNRIDRLDSAKRRTLDVANKLTELAADWTRVRSELQALQADTLSKDDAQKLALLQLLFSEQLKEYGVTSVNPSEISISSDSFRAVYGDFDLQFDLSASDTIRSAWAYRTALLEVARTAPTNHPGLLVFDEPRQQEASTDSFAAFLKRLAAAGNAGQQVIVATSEPEASLMTLIAGLPVRVISYSTPILQQR